MGVSASNYEWHKYVPDLLTIYGNFAYHIDKPGSFMFGIEIGSTLWIPTGEDEDEDQTELLAHYGIKVGIQSMNIAVFTELVGLAVITEDFEEGSDRYVHAIGICAQLTQKTIRPGIFYQQYLKKDLNDYVTGVLGLKLDVSF